MLANRGYYASAVTYGVPTKDLDAALEGAFPIVGSFGAKGNQLAGATTTLKWVSQKKKIAQGRKAHPSVGHAVMNLNQVCGPAFGTLIRITGAKPKPEAAGDAWQRIETFFGALELVSSNPCHTLGLRSNCVC